MSAVTLSKNPARSPSRLNMYFHYDAHIMSGALARPEFANCDGSRGSRYGHFYVGGLAEALLVLKGRANVPA